MTDRPLEPVSSYNARRREERRARELAARMTGVACPRCGGELMWCEPHGWEPLYVTMSGRSTATAWCYCGEKVELER